MIGKIILLWKKKSNSNIPSTNSVQFSPLTSWFMGGRGEPERNFSRGPLPIHSATAHCEQFIEYALKDVFF